MIGVDLRVDEVEYCECVCGGHKVMAGLPGSEGGI